MTEATMTDVRQIEFSDSQGEPMTLADLGEKAILVVNVASKCGLTPQYETLEQLQRTYGDRGFTVIGFPCNQFMGQEPGSMGEILDYCATTWGISFPIADKVKVNGGKAAPLYQALRETRDDSGKKGRVQWNFEKFLVAPNGSIQRFRPNVVPDDPAIISAIEAALPA